MASSIQDTASEHTERRVPTELLAGLRDHLLPLPASPGDEDHLLAHIGDARFVLLGEASHGTLEFYRERAAITKRLILQKHLNAIVMEADWPDAWRVNRYVRGLPALGPEPADSSAAQALSGFERFPAWMWRNVEVRDFVQWLRRHNSTRSSEEQVGFYGMDLYSLFKSMQDVLAYLDRTDPAAARRARSRYACFDQVHEDSQAYGYAATFGLARSCEDDVVQQLSDMTARIALSAPGGGLDDNAFCAAQNARLVRNAEAYYRTMFHGRVSSWNLRDEHMAQTLNALDQHLSQGLGRPARLAVWAHNSHLGDASATDMGASGEHNLGQLLRQQHGQDAYLLGMSTHHGTVTAASDWDDPPHRKHVRPGLPGSWEDCLHHTGTPRFLLLLKNNPALQTLTDPLRLQRAIGVIYRPSTERKRHYLHTHLPRQFDALLHIDETQALEPLEKGHIWTAGEAPETYPFGV